MAQETFELNKGQGESYPEEFKKLAEYVKSIKFGSVTVQIQDGRIIQIDKNEKFRFDKKER
ncbi:MAG: YezD family protein [Treponema sp.]|nr:YezD family protein [Treponema sp.]MCR5623034.1 YezD family protein [Treponema sp.]